MKRQAKNSEIQQARSSPKAQRILRQIPNSYLTVSIVCQNPRMTAVCARFLMKSCPASIQKGSGGQYRNDGVTYLCSALIFVPRSACKNASKHAEWRRYVLMHLWSRWGQKQEERDPPKPKVLPRSTVTSLSSPSLAS